MPWRPGRTPARESGDFPASVLSTQTWAPTGSVAISIPPVWTGGRASADGGGGAGRLSSTAIPTRISAPTPRRGGSWLESHRGDRAVAGRGAWPDGATPPSWAGTPPPPRGFPPWRQAINGI